MSNRMNISSLSSSMTSSYTQKQGLKKLTRGTENKALNVFTFASDSNSGSDIGETHFSTFRKKKSQKESSVQITNKSLEVSTLSIDDLSSSSVKRTHDKRKFNISGANTWSPSSKKKKKKPVATVVTETLEIINYEPSTITEDFLHEKIPTKVPYSRQCTGRKKTKKKNVSSNITLLNSDEIIDKEKDEKHREIICSLNLNKIADKPKKERKRKNEVKTKYRKSTRSSSSKKLVRKSKSNQRKVKRKNKREFENVAPVLFDSRKSILSDDEKDESLPPVLKCETVKINDENSNSENEYSSISSLSNICLKGLFSSHQLTSNQQILSDLASKVKRRKKKKVHSKSSISGKRKHVLQLASLNCIRTRNRSIEKCKKRFQKHSHGKKKALKKNTRKTVSFLDVPEIPNVPQLLYTNRMHDVFNKVLKLMKDTKALNITHAEIMTPEFLHFNEPKYFTMDEICHADERQGQIKLCIVTNSSGIVNYKQKLLKTFMNIIQYDLSDMKRKLIEKLVFNLEQKTMTKNLVLLGGNTLYGGICFRIFVKQNFAEIIFIALLPTENRKGYGTYMVKRLKDYLRVKHKIYHIITFADKSAVSFFQAQGFNRVPKSKILRYEHYTGDYENVVLMEFWNDFFTNHSNFKFETRRQIKALKVLKKLNVKLNDNDKNKICKLHEGLPFYQDAQEIPFKRIPALGNIGLMPYKKCLKHPFSFEEFNNILDDVMDALMNHQYTMFFYSSPVEIADDDSFYPMDLYTVRKRIEDDYYCCKDLFVCDVQRTFNNCRKFESPVVKYVDIVEEHFKNIVKAISVLFE